MATGGGGGGRTLLVHSVKAQNWNCFNIQGLGGGQGDQSVRVWFQDSLKFQPTVLPAAGMGQLLMHSSSLKRCRQTIKLKLTFNLHSA